ncbi:hypothetical protein [Silvibacterium sp.]|uniref:hypothetical protein n=1 Tax=Silvibacterium sp. TaxID=1964179 RepID=UPI0039E3F5C7
MESGRQRTLNVLKRSGLWFGCVLTAMALFSACMMLAPPFHWDWDGYVLVYRITSILALPVALLFLPAVLRFRQASAPQMLAILSSGVLVGPVALVLWSQVMIWHGANADMVWHGDPEVGFGIWGEAKYAALVGFLSTTLYILSFRALGVAKNSR